MRTNFTVAILVLIMISALTYGLQGEGEEMTARAVVETQLKALKSNDTPAADHGINVAWDYAHPLNKANTGPLPRFTRMLYSSAYKPLINHRSHTITELESSASSAAFQVLVISGDGTQLEYIWAVQRIDREDESSAWRTTAVSPPRPTGENLA